MSTILKTGPAPHIRTAETVESVMYDVIIALIPALTMAIYTYYEIGRASCRERV